MPSNPDPSNSGKFSRPIDAPSLPPWSRASEVAPQPQVLVPAPMPPDETPTLSGEAFPAAPESEDPRELARRLAQEAKQKALARKGGSQEEPMRTDDPRDLARRLAEEAKRRLNPGLPPEPEPEPEPSVTSWDQPAAALDDPGFERPDEPSMPVFSESVFPRGVTQPVHDAPTDDTDPDPGPDADPDPEPPPDLPTTFARGRSLAERAAAVQPRTGLSAAEALAAARLAEMQAQAKPAARPAPAAAPSAHAAPAPAPRPAAPAPAPRPTPAAAAPPSAPPAGFADLLPGATIEPPIAVSQPEVFRALWRAHRARALHDRQLELVATASVLLDAADRGARIVAARATIGGRTWAVWLDADRGVLLGAAQPPEVYLAGL
jgi:hypothetical protein